MIPADSNIVSPVPDDLRTRRPTHPVKNLVRKIFPDQAPNIILTEDLG